MSSTLVSSSLENVGFFFFFFLVCVDSRSGFCKKCQSLIDLCCDDFVQFVGFLCLFLLFIRAVDPIILFCSKS